MKSLGNLQDAELSKRKALELKPNNENSHRSLGYILMNKGKHIEGIKQLRKGSGYIIFNHKLSEVNFLSK